MRAYGLIIAMCLAAFTAATASAQLRIVPREKLEAVSDPRLTTDSSSLCFDTTHIVAEPMNEDDSPRIFGFRFTNVGNEILHIDRLVSTCSCAAATCTLRDVAPGQSSIVSVRYSPKGHPGRFERKVFVYTQEGNAPAAVLRLSVEVAAGQDISSEWPVQMGTIRMRRSSVDFLRSVKAVETVRFINVADKPLELECETAFLPDCITFLVEPSVVGKGQEGQIKIGYDPSRPGSRDNMKIILKGLGLPPSGSSLTVRLRD